MANLLTEGARYIKTSGLVGAAEIPSVSIGILQARIDPKVRDGEQERVQKGFATAERARVETTFYETTSPRGLLQGTTLSSFMDRHDGWLVTGTSDMDEFHRDTSTPEGKLREQYHNEVDPVLQEGVKRGSPMLTFCYGAHGLVVAVFGEETVQYASHHEEFGTVSLIATPAGIEDPILAGMPNEFDILSGHKGSVIEDELPPDAIELLASTVNTPVSLFRLRGTQAYGVQQHPEADHDYVKIIDENFDALAGSGLRPYRRTHEFGPPHPDTPKLLGNFAGIVYKASR